MVLDLKVSISIEIIFSASFEINFLQSLSLQTSIPFSVVISSVSYSVSYTTEILPALYVRSDTLMSPNIEFADTVLKELSSDLNFP